MIGREERTAEIGARNAVGGVPALEVSGLTTSLGHREVSFTLKQGEILGLYGLVGSGRTELVRALMGDARILAGEIRLRGEPIFVTDTPTAVRRYRMGYVSEDRKSEGLILADSIRANIAITVWRSIASRLGLLTRRAEERVAEPLARRLDIRTPSLDQQVGKLSGGNQQKVSIAKWLAAGVDILIIDEPTVGIDIKTKAAIHELIAEITRGGVSVLLISSDMPEMITLADRILIMRDFVLVGEIENERRYETMSRRIMGFIHGEIDMVDAKGQAEANHG
jgi:ribose transport system ATP-binding protein